MRLNYLNISGSVDITGSVTVRDLSTNNSNRLVVIDPNNGKLYYSTTASYAATASVLLGSVTSASYALTASSATFAASALTASYFITQSVSSSTTASYAFVAASGTGSFTGSFIGAHSGSFSGSFTGSFTGTGSQSVSASYALTASSAIFATSALTASYFVTQSVSSATSASYAATASSADSFLVRNNLTASNALITNTITAQTLIVQTVTSSVVYSSGSNTFGSQSVDRQQFTGSVTITGSLTVTGRATITNLTGSLFGTASWASNALTASYFVTSSVASASYALTASSATFAASALTASYFVTQSVSSSTTASFAFTASSVNTLNQNVVITGSLTIGTSSVGPFENTITLGARDAANEGGQIGFNAPGGTFTSSSFIDNWSNYIRILRGTNATSTGLVAQWNLHTLQMELPGYTNASSFVGTATANLAVDSNGRVITVSTTGGSVFPYTGNAVITGSLTVTQPIYVPINGGMYFQGGDDAALYDINVSNHMGIYGVQDSTVASIKLGSGGGIISGRSSSIGIGTTLPVSGTLHVNGNIFATSLTGSLFGTASWANNALTASYFVTQSVTSASYALTASSAIFAASALTASYFLTSSVTSASYALTASSAIRATSALTASYFVTQSVTSASYALTASSATFAASALTASYFLTQSVTNATSASFAATASSADNFLVRSNLTASNALVNGTITAQTLVVSTVSSSVVYSSGSNIFGNSTANVQQFTGSVLITSSLTINGDGLSVVNSNASYVSTIFRNLPSYAINANDAVSRSGLTVRPSSAGSETITFSRNVNNIQIQAVDTGFTPQGLSLNPFGGNVSIGKTLPSFNLDISGSTVITGSLTVTQGITGSLFGTASWAQNSLTASYFLTSSVTSASYALTASSATFAASALTASYFVTQSVTNAATASSGTNFTINGTLTFDATLTDYARVVSSIVGANNLFTQTVGSYTSAFFKYTATNGVNTRAGEVVAAWNGTTATYTDFSTVDIGDTSDVTTSVSIVAGSVQFNVTTGTSGWAIKSLATFM